jgi:hypothetical protein
VWLTIKGNKVCRQWIWFSNQSLIINTDKTKAILFNFNTTCNLVKPKIVFKNVEISYTSVVKFLGINISNNLKWDTHIQFLSSKFKKVSFMITSLRGDLGLFMLRNIYFVIFQSLIRYGIIFCSGEIKSSKVLKIQERVLHAIKGLNKRQFYRPIFKQLKIFTVTALCTFEVLCYLKITFI